VAVLRWGGYRAGLDCSGGVQGAAGRPWTTSAVNSGDLRGPPCGAAMRSVQQRSRLWEPRANLSALYTQALARMPRFLGKMLRFGAGLASFGQMLLYLPLALDVSDCSVIGLFTLHALLTMLNPPDRRQGMSPRSFAPHVARLLLERHDLPPGSQHSPTTSQHRSGLPPPPRYPRATTPRSQPLLLRFDLISAGQHLSPFDRVEHPQGGARMVGMGPED
jgi:hypothetical protein